MEQAKLRFKDIPTETELISARVDPVRINLRLGVKDRVHPCGAARFKIVGGTIPTHYGQKGSDCTVDTQYSNATGYIVS
ncbi:unnamed protein product [Aspergillus oryzae]|uniref:Unnamed protein product n=2 Tax=Aspergillus oryzae TaxID=5062 RepID=A0AAN4YNN4_ASPOZ|nr:unnamed protein product [Aspergillus oryzae]GMF92014.1 unnamed protein product [Aspergillus oryzae]GMG33163.1 unnamed protein product [Aspergillus oryzae]GMG53159.1 unnamed protein product [Aspergillus oryzae var. brunneus]